MRDVTDYERAILFKLYHKKFFGKHHISEDNLLRGFPPDKVGDMQHALDALKRDGIVQRKAALHGKAVYLSPRLAPEVYEQLKRFYPWLPKPPWAAR